MSEPMTEERLTELETLDRGPCLPAVRELAAELRRERNMRRVNPAAKWLWLILVLFAELAGLCFGISLFVEDFWLSTVAGMFAFGGVLVLGAGLWKLEKPRG